MLLLLAIPSGGGQNGFKEMSKFSSSYGHLCSLSRQVLLKWNLNALNYVRFGLEINQLQYEPLKLIKNL